MAGTLKHLTPKGNGEVTPHHIVTDLTKELPNTDEIYVVTKEKTGDWTVSSSGRSSGIAMAIALLQMHFQSQMTE